MAQQPQSFFDKIKQSWSAAVQTWTAGGGSGPMVATWQTDGMASILSEEEKHRLEVAGLAWDFYRGEHPPAVNVRPGKPDDNVIINFSRVIVNMGVSFLMGEGVNWDVEGEEGVVDDVKALLDGVFGQDEVRTSFLLDVGYNGSLAGDAFIMIEWETGWERPKLRNLNPQHTFAEFDAGDSSKIIGWRLTKPKDAEGNEQILHLFIDEEGRWRWRDEVYIRGEWQAVPDTDGVWPWAWSPITHIKNLPNPNQHYGISDLEDGDLNIAVNKISSYTMRSGRLFPHPLLYGYGIGEDHLDTSAFYDLQSPEGFIKSVQMDGAMAESSEFANRLSTWFFMVNQTPSMNPELMRLGAQSGFALRVLYGPLLDKTRIKRALYGAGLKEIIAHLAEVAGITGDFTVTLRWANPLPYSIDEENSRDQFALDNGLASKQTIATSRGYDYNAEQERIKEERDRDRDFARQLREDAARAFNGGMPE